MLGEAIQTILTGYAPLTSVVGTSIYPVQAPERVSSPFVVYSFIRGTPANQKDGVSPIDGVLLQVDIYSTSVPVSNTIAEHVRAVLDNYSGTENGTTIRRIWYDTQDDGDYLEALGFFGISQAYNLKYER